MKKCKLFWNVSYESKLSRIVKSNERYVMDALKGVKKFFFAMIYLAGIMNS